MLSHPSSRPPDTVASLTLALVAAAALAASWFLPWWVMEARAPQYGQRTLVVSVSPVRLGGDVFEVDTLGHYVGIRPMTTLAAFERALAPYGLLAAIAGVLAAPWIRRRWLRLVALLPVVVLPFAFLVDLQYWMDKSVSERDLDAALNLTVTSVDPRLLGKYELGQFKVSARVDSGLLLTGGASLLALGLLFARPLVRGRASQVGLSAGLLALALPAPARAAEHRVGPGESLAAAVAAAAPGDTIRIAPGVHETHLRVDRRLRLLGDPGAILDGGGAGTVLDVRAPGVEIRHLTIRASGDSLTREDSAIRIERAAGTRVSDVHIEDALFGVFAVQANATVIERSWISGKGLSPDRRGDAIRFLYSNDCRLLDNRVERSRDVILWYSNRTLVEGNVVRHGRYGLHYMDSDHNVFRRNVFEDNQVGASIMYSRNIELTDNSFSFSNGIAAYGLLVKESSDIFVAGNRFVGNATAIFLDSAPHDRGSRLVLQRNLIARNQVGIALQPLTRGAEIWRNAFIGNDVQVEVSGAGTADGNSWAVGGRGNYWSDAVVYDRDGDGVSEIPYRVESTFEALVARTPAIAWLAMTPAADAIDGAARLFPIFAARPRMTDPQPLMEPPVAGLETGSGSGRRFPLIAAGASLLAVAVQVGLAAAKVLS